MNEEIKRYSLMAFSWDEGEMEEDDKGDFVKHEDHEAKLAIKQAEIEAYEKRFLILEDRILDMFTCDYYDKITRLQDEIRARRRAEKIVINRILENLLEESPDDPGGIPKL